MNLLTKVLLTLALVLAVALLTSSILIGRSVDDTYRSYVTNYRRGQLEQAAAQAAGLYAAGAGWDEIETWLNSGLLPGSRGQQGQGRGPRWQREGVSGAVGLDLVLVDPVSGGRLVDDQAPVSPVAVAAAEPVVVDRETVALIATTAPLDSFGQAEQAVLDQINRAIGISALISGLVALVLGGLLVVSILRPLRRLEAGVERIAGGDLTTRVEPSGRDEIGQLADRFNSMAASLEAQEALRRRMVADIAHELRTPLSVIQGNLQAILDGVYPLEEDEIRTVHDETRLLSRLVADLHELAQAEAGQLPLAVEPLSAGDVVAQMVAGFRALAEQKGVRLTALPPVEPLCVTADANRLQQVLHNLLGNGVRHTPAGGEIRLGVTPAAGQRVRFWVENDGPGIPAADLPHVYERFYQADTSRAFQDDLTSGAGLGLAIVKALIEAHGGEVGVESTPGRQTVFWVELGRC